MSDQDKERLSQLEAERDDLKVKYEAEKAEREKEAQKRSEFERKQRTEIATRDAKDFFDGLGARITPAEREVAEPMMVVLMATEDGAKVTFSKADSETPVDMAEGIKSLFEARRNLPEDLFRASMQKADPNEETTTDGAEAEVIQLANAHMEEKDGKVSYSEALAHVKTAKPELWQRYQDERSQKTPRIAPSK